MEAWFRLQAKSRLYALKPGQQHSERRRISNKEELEEVFGYIEEQPDDCDVESLQVLFIYPNDASPYNSPNKNRLEIIEEVKNDSTSNTSDSTKKYGSKEIVFD